MGCGCNKKRAAVLPATGTPAEQVARARAAGAVVEYDVYGDDNTLVASFSNPVTARAEARRVNGTTVPRSSSFAAAPRLPGSVPEGTAATDAATNQSDQGANNG